MGHICDGIVLNCKVKGNHGICKNVEERETIKWEMPDSGKKKAPGFPHIQNADLCSYHWLYVCCIYLCVFVHVCGEARGSCVFSLNTCYLIFETGSLTESLASHFC